MKWAEKAQCRGIDINTFVPPEGKKNMGPRMYASARTYCERCSVTKECLEYAINEELTSGMYGGLTPRERRLIVRSRQKAG